MGAEGGLEAGSQASNQLESNAAEDCALVESATPIGLEWISDGVDRSIIGDFQQEPGNSGEEVCVFVGVEVGDVDASILQLLNLCDGFAGDLIFVDATT